MTQSRVDLAVGLLITLVLVVGFALTYQMYQAASDGMGHGWAMHGVHPIWNLLGTLLVAVVIAGMYALVRNQLRMSTTSEMKNEAETVERTSKRLHKNETVSATAADQTDSSGPSPDEILEYLPEDERRILTPVVESPGLTQIELRDRADFSKSKISQTVAALEKRGLLYREPQGRTYRVYPTKTLQPGTNES